MKARARAEAAWAQLEYAEREAAIMKQKAKLEAELVTQKADLESSLHLLQSQRAAAAATAEAAAYEDDDGSVKSELSQDLPDLSCNPAERTSDYVRQHSKASSEGKPFRTDTQQTHGTVRDTREVFNHADGKIKVTEQENIYANSKQTKEELKTRMFPSGSATQTLYPLREPQLEAKGVQDVTNYLIRCEMMSAGHMRFDDKPENYWSWKASFQGVTKDLNLSAREELCRFNDKMAW